MAPAVARVVPQPAGAVALRQTEAPRRKTGVAPPDGKAAAASAFAGERCWRCRFVRSVVRPRRGGHLCVSGWKSGHPGVRDERQGVPQLPVSAARRGRNFRHRRIARFGRNPVSRGKSEHGRVAEHRRHPRLAGQAARSRLAALRRTAAAFVSAFRTSKF